jgi:hypothetical protein
MSRRAPEGVDHIKWQEAIQTEVNDNMFRKGPLVKEVPKGVKRKDFTLIYSTMQLNLKLKDDGTIDKYNNISFRTAVAVYRNWLLNKPNSIIL